MSFRAGHLAAHARAGAVGGQQRLHRHADGAIALVVADPGSLRREIGRFEPMLEMQPDARASAGRFDERSIEQVPGNRVNHLIGALPVRLEGRGVARVMNLSAAHRQQRRTQAIEYACNLQRMDAAVGQGQVDGSARVGERRARIGSGFIEFDLLSAALEQNGEQRAGGSCADDAYHGELTPAPLVPGSQRPRKRRQMSCTAGSAPAAVRRVPANRPPRPRR